MTLLNSFDDRRYFSRVLMAAGAFSLFFGWFFLVAGIGIVFLTLGLLLIIVGVGLDWSRQAVILGALSFIVGCSPILFLLAWIALGLGNQ